MIFNSLNPKPEKGLQNQYPSKQTSMYEEEENGSFSEEILQEQLKAWETVAEDTS